MASAAISATPNGSCTPTASTSTAPRPLHRSGPDARSATGRTVPSARSLRSVDHSRSTSTAATSRTPTRDCKNSRSRSTP